MPRSNRTSRLQAMNARRLSQRISSPSRVAISMVVRADSLVSIPEKWLTVFTHDPAIPWACVEKDEIGKMAAQRYNDPLFFGNFLVKLILLT